MSILDAKIQFFPGKNLATKPYRRSYTKAEQEEDWETKGKLRKHR